MGTVQTIDVAARSVPTSQPTNPGESQIYRNIRCLLENGGTPIETFRSQPESRTPIDILRTSSVKFANFDCTGERIINPDGSAGPYQFRSYEEFYRRALAMGRGMLSLGLTRGDKIGIYGSNSEYWQMVAFGANSVGLTLVPVYDSLGKDAAQYIINHAEVKALFCNRQKYPNIVAVIPEIQQTVSTLVILGDSAPLSPESSLPLKTCKELLEIGNSSTVQNEFSRPDDLAVIMYTSGSTGTPKGCMLTSRNVVAGSVNLAVVNASAGPGDTHLSFLPLAHIYAMTVELIMYAQGARVGFARGPVKDLIDDIQALQPTVLIAVPRVLNKVADQMRSQISKRSFVVQAILYRAIDAKIRAVRQNKPQSLLIDSLLFTPFRKALGGRLRAIISGGAPILPEIAEFLGAVVTPNIVQGYGLTEVSSGCSVQEMPALDPTTVGPSSIGCEIRLRPVEGTDYNPTDPVSPAGELLIRGACVFQGYYKQPELTSEVLSDGWFASGDIARITPSGHLRIIDRAKQLVKLSQGEYLSMTMLNDVYCMADIASFVYVYANSSYDQPVAVVIPKPEKLKEWRGRDLKRDEKVMEEVLASLGRVFDERKLRGFERISHCLIDIVEPTVENGLLTPSMKPQYAALRKKYEGELMELYQAKVK